MKPAPHFEDVPCCQGALPILKHTKKVIMKINIHKLECVYVCRGVGGGGRFLWMNSAHPL